MKFLQYLLESDRIQEIGRKAIIEHLNSGRFDDAIESYKTGNKIYKGSTEYGEYGSFVDPAATERKSSSAKENIYNLITSYGKGWEKYPKRSRSIICSTGTQHASEYGDIYVILPEDGSLIGVASDTDIWGSFKKTIGKKTGGDGYMGHFNRVVMLLLQRMGSGLYSFDTFDKLSDNCKLFDIYLEKNDGDIESELRETSSYVSKHEQMVKRAIIDNYNGDLLQCLEKILDPKINSISLKKVGAKLPKNREVWTNGKCLVINGEYIEEFIRE